MLSSQSTKSALEMYRTGYYLFDQSPHPNTAQGEEASLPPRAILCTDLRDRCTGRQCRVQTVNMASLARGFAVDTKCVLTSPQQFGGVACAPVLHLLGLCHSQKQLSGVSPLCPPCGSPGQTMSPGVAACSLARRAASLASWKALWTDCPCRPTCMQACGLSVT